MSSTILARRIVLQGAAGLVMASALPFGAEGPLEGFAPMSLIDGPGRLASDEKLRAFLVSLRTEYDPRDLSAQWEIQRTERILAERAANGRKIADG